MYVYILKCNDKSYYTGVTNNLERRLAEHQSGEVMSCYTFKRRPISLVFYQKFQTPKEAILFEKKVKGWTRAKKEALIESNWERLHQLAKCLNSTSHENYKSPFDSAHSPFDSAQGDGPDTTQGDNPNSPSATLGTGSSG